MKTITVAVNGSNPAFTLVPFNGQLGKTEPALYVEDDDTKARDRLVTVSQLLTAKGSSSRTTGHITVPVVDTTNEKLVFATGYITLNLPASASNDDAKRLIDSMTAYFADPTVVESLVSGRRLHGEAISVESEAPLSI